MTSLSSLSDPRSILRVASFLSILFGTLSFLTSIQPRMWPPEISVLRLVSPEEALGFTFLGFAVRLLRLEIYSTVVRVVVRTSRICLVIVGALGLQGVGISPEALAGHPGKAGFAASVLFLLLGLRLCISGGIARSPLGTPVLAGATLFVASCWIALCLKLAGMLELPWMFEIGIPSLMLLTLVCAGLVLSSRMRGVFDVLFVKGPAAMAARQTFPVVILLPVVLAVVRHQAESAGLLKPQMGLLLHVLLSIGIMAALFAWQTHRLVNEQRHNDAVEAITRAAKSEQRAVLAQLAEPAWIFDGAGKLQFTNEAAASFVLPETAQGSPLSMEEVLGRKQFQEVLRTVIFGRELREVTLHDLASGRTQARPIVYLSAQGAEKMVDISVLLIAGHATAETAGDLARLADYPGGKARTASTALIHGS